MSVQTKTDIQNRMIKKAADLWGVSPNDIDSTFDPVVSLLIGACATELSKISNEVNGSQLRITEKLIQLMTPEASYGAQPAHAIAHACPTEPSIDIVPANQLYAKKKIKSLDGDVSFKSAFFSPVKEFKLINSRIKLALTGNQLISFEESKKTSIVDSFSFIEGNTLASSTIYFGIQPTSQKTSLKDVSLFFELNDVANQELFYNQLKHTEFFFGENPVSINYGYNDNQSEEKRYIEEVFSDKSSKTIVTEQQVLTNYKRHYVTINSGHNLKSKPVLPEALKKIDFSDHEELEGLHWLKVTFPSTITNNLLKSTYCSFNTFPVLNRRLESTSYQLKDFANIVPFSSSDLFLDIRKISNDKGQEYHVLDSDSEKNKGTYTLRDENVGRLDSRKAKDHLVHLIDLLKNESAAFSILGSDFLMSNIQKLNQDISLLENRVSEMSIQKEENHYISIQPYRKNETIFLEFWSTIGELSNSLRSNTSLQVYKGAELNQQSCFLVTPTSQGKNTLSSNERLFKYRRALLSRQRIVTPEDVKALCFDICGDTIKNVVIVKEFMVHQDYKKGKLPTLVIKITKNTQKKASDLEWEMMKNNILSTLEEQSTNVFPYYLELK